MKKWNSRLKNRILYRIGHSYLSGKKFQEFENNMVLNLYISKFQTIEEKRR